MAAVGAVGGSGVGRYLQREGSGVSVVIGCEEGRSQMGKGMLTGFVGREEMMLSIESRRSGYISARRTSRSVGGGS